MRIYIVVLISLALAFASCSDEWGNHYGQTPKTVNAKLWDTIKANPDYSEFVKYMEFYQLDTIIKTSNTKTLFIPKNEAFADSLVGDTTGFKGTMQYHIVPTLFMIQNVRDFYRLRTLSEKFANIVNENNTFKVNGLEITYSSPLFVDGKYYEITEISKPLPSLYEYIRFNNSAIRKYIDTQDTIILNKEESEPLGYDSLGRTIYDSVTTVENIWEQEYFAISEEYRNIRGTMVLPNEELYNQALDEMASNLSAEYEDHEDIPVDWQNNLLIPTLLKKGTYGGILNPIDFQREKIANIRGDSIIKDFQIDQYSKFTCSNGVAYNYSSFSVGDSLYKEYVVEGEALLDSIGLGRYSWDQELVKIEGNTSFEPTKQRVASASNDSTVNMEFDTNFKGEFSITFNINYVFPDDYLLVWRTNYRTTGRYSIYVNGEKVLLGYNTENPDIGNYEDYDTYKLRNGFFSVLGYRKYPDRKGFCEVDGYVTIPEYQNVTITIEYIGPGESTDNGLSLDYVGLIPAKN